MDQVRSAVRGIPAVFAALTFVVMAGSPGVLFAQQDRATIEGLVTDNSGATVPDAKVSVVRVQTNNTIVLKTNTEGRFFAPNLPIGTYNVSVTKAGFETADAKNLILQSQMSVRADFTLKVGAINEHVEVNDEAPMVDASNATVAAPLTTKQIDDLPLITIGRKLDITSYLQYLPGVTTTSTWGARVNGSNPGNSEIFLDGAPASQNNVRGGIQENGPAVEQVGEFSIVTNAFNAEYGRTGSWFTNVTIRSGTNQLHGRLYDYLDNNALNARSFFQTTRTVLRQNEGGGTIGGPVVIPKVYNGHNKTFFFFGQELTYWRQSGTGALFTDPIDSFRTGNFSNLVSASGAQIPIFDPQTTRPDGNGGFVRDPFPGNIIPANRISPQAANILPLIPEPNIPGSETNNFHNRTGGGSYDNYLSTIKIDHSFSDRHKLSILYSDQYCPQILAGNGWGVTNPLEGSQSPKSIHDRTGRINYDYIIRPNLLSHFTIGIDRYNNKTVEVTQFQGWDQKLGIQGNLWDQGAFPYITFGGGTASPQTFGGNNFSQNANGRYTVTENVTWVKGRHSIKFGGNYWPEYANEHEAGTSSGSFSFSNLTTSQPDAAQYTSYGSSFASFLLGGVSSASLMQPNITGTRFRSMALFAQDEWRATKRLTLSYGLRWEGNAAPYATNGVASGFDPNIPNPAAGGLPGALIFAGTGAGRSGSDALSNGWYKGFGPRLGAAYAATPRTVIRGSGGIYYAPGFRTRLIQYGFFNAPSVTSPDGYDPAYYWTSPFPAPAQLAPFLSPSFQNGQSVSSVLPGTSRMPQILTWTLSVQREIAHNLAFESTYIGSHSTHLILGGSGGGSGLSNLNTLPLSDLALGNLLFQPVTSAAAQAAGIAIPYPGFVTQPSITVGQALRPYPQYLNISQEWAPEGIARFNSLQLKLTKRYSSGLTLLAFYTWSKEMTNTEGGPIDLGPSDGAQQNPNNRASEVSVSTNGPPSVFVASGTYELPFGLGKAHLSNTHALSRIVGGWQITAYARYTDGLPLTITSGDPLSALGFPNIRANYVGGDPYGMTNPRNFNPATSTYLNPAAFAAPSEFQLGNTARALDWVRGFSGKSETLSLAKRIPITERVRAILRADAQNPFNFVRWSNPSTNITSSTFGKVTSAAAGRTIQLNATVEF
jgi:hypothetical protein